MNPKFVLPNFIILLVLFSCTTGIGSAEISFTDSEGNLVPFPGPAEKLVCLNSDSAEMVVALGAGDRIVGLADSVMSDTALMDHIPNAVSVGNWQTPNFEKVLELKPDVVISYSSSKPKNSDQFLNAGINLTYLDCYRINTLDHDVKAMGTLLGASDRADLYVKFKDKWQNLVSSRVANLAPDQIPSVYIEGYSDYSANGKGSGVDQELDVAKGKNIAASLGEQWPKVTAEWVLSQNPDVIIKAVSLKPDKTLEQVRDDILHRSGFETLSAVKNNQVYALNGDLAYGPRSPAGLVYVAKALHPSLFNDIHPDDVLKEYADTFVSGVEKGEYYSPVL